MTMGLSRKHGFQIDEKTDAAQVQANADVLVKIRDRMHQGFIVPTEDTFSEGIIAYQQGNLSVKPLQEYFRA